MKVCTKCKISKPLTDFHRSQRNRSGVSSWCKVCDYKRTAGYRVKNRPKIRRKLREWQNDNRDKVNEYNRKFREKEGKRSRIYMKVWRAVAKGELLKTPCQVCGSKRVEAHHEDYSKPLEVVWLCLLHHKQQHAHLPILVR